MVLYFTGTGNSKYIAERIATALNEDILSMNDRIKEGNTANVMTGKNMVIVVPTYAWRIPPCCFELVTADKISRSEENLVCDGLWWRNWKCSKIQSGIKSTIASFLYGNCTACDAGKLYRNVWSSG